MATINKYYPESVTHPGIILAEALEEKEIGSKEFAVRTGKPEKTISAVLKGESAITPSMAVLFEQVLQIPVHFWLEAQKNYDEYKARLEYQVEIENAIEWARSFPYPQMANLNWVSSTKKAEEKVVNLFEFFGVANLKGFQNYYFHEKTKVAFRISLKGNKNATAIAAWLRQGEVQAEKIEVPPFNKTALKRDLPELKGVMATQPKNFFKQLQEICLRSGVKVVHTPCLPRTAIHGSTRWINDTPLIQLSGRFKRNDIFWFTFFHEVGHILLHGKKYISLENVDYQGENEDYEREADTFAMKWILTEEEVLQIVHSSILDEKTIKEFAQKFQTHPACIIGRLQHEGYIRYGLGNNFFEPIDFSDCK